MSIDNQIITERSIYPRPLTLGKGVRGKLANAVRESQIPLIDYFNRRGQHAITPGSAHLPTPLPSEEGLQDMGDGEFSGFNTLFPRLVQAFLLNRKFYVQDMYIEGVPTSNSEHILPILFDMYRSRERKRNNGVVARVVFGASEKMSLRSLSYVLPALLHMQHLQDETEQTIPQLQIIFAKHTGGELNGLDAETVTEETALFARVASEFIQKFFPKLRQHVVFLEDMPLGETAYYGQLQAVLDVLDGKADFTLLEEKATIRRGTQTAKLYGAAHVLLHETRAEGILRPVIDEDGLPLFPDESILPATGVITYGGMQELPFYALRQDARARISAVLPSVQFFTRHHIPPYFMAEGKDLGLREAIMFSRNERQKRRESLAPKEKPNVTYQPRGKSGPVNEDMQFLEKVAFDQDLHPTDPSSLDTFLDEQADTAKTI